MNTRCLLFQLCICISLLSANLAFARTLVIGTISDEPVKEIRTFLPFVKYLAKQLETSGIDDGKVVIARDIDHMASLIRKGEVDLFVDSPLVALAINEKTGCRLLARRWKKGIAEYHSVVFVRQDSDIASVHDLGGRVVAFEESFSSSGHLLPRITMERMGVSLMQLPNLQSNVPSEQSGFVFSGDDENTMEWVLRDRVDAGAMSMANFKKRVATNRADLKIVLETADIPRHSVSLSPTVSEQLFSAIEAALFTMHESEEGQIVLESFEQTTKFDPIPSAMMAQLELFQIPVTGLVDGN